MISHNEDFRIMPFVTRQVLSSAGETFPYCRHLKKIIRLRCFLINLRLARAREALPRVAYLHAR